MVYDTTIIIEHPFLVISGPMTTFWAGQEVSEASQPFLTF